MAVKTALVIDDSKSARIMLSRLVQKNGLEVAMVESGEEGISFLESNPLPDVIFMDHMMPGMDGLETTKVISANPQTKHIPILMYTSKEGPEYEQEMLASGAYGMLGKPAKPDKLKSLIEELNARPEPIMAAEPVEPETTQPATPITPEAETETIIEEPVAQEEEEMSQELIEEVASKLIARAIEDSLQPLNNTIHRLETAIHENQSEIRKLSSRQDQNANHVSQSVLDASLKQTTVQLQNQIVAEIKSVRDVIEQRAELSPSALQQIKDVATEAGKEAGSGAGEKTAASAAEAVAAKVSAAQAQIQVQQDIQPYVEQAKTAKTIAIVSIIVAAASIAASFIL